MMRHCHPSQQWQYYKTAPLGANQRGPGQATAGAHVTKYACSEPKRFPQMLIVPVISPAIFPGHGRYSTLPTRPTANWAYCQPAQSATLLPGQQASRPGSLHVSKSHGNPKVLANCQACRQGARHEMLPCIGRRLGLYRQVLLPVCLPAYSAPPAIRRTHCRAVSESKRERRQAPPYIQYIHSGQWHAAHGVPLR